ncbi:MAG: DUF58 domain-containing protein [Phycisphaerales bacterium]|nr:DUF58 domain-containing protein [Phycisphaerales bacterium]
MTVDVRQIQENGGDGGLSPGLMRKLEKLRIASKVMHPGASMGERMSRARGSGMEFADHKEYSSGDDFRMIDWNVYARLDEFVVRLYETEENLSVCILVDASASMDFGKNENGGGKWEIAKRLAAGLGYVAMANRDSLTMFLFAGKIDEKLEATRGKGHLRQMLSVLDTATPSGQSDFKTALRSAGSQLHRAGICFVISDFCGSGDLGEAIKGLAYYGHEVVILHVVDALEAEPELEGEVDVEDAETGEVVPMTVKGDTLAKYKEAFESRCRSVAAACAMYNAIYLRVATAESVENTILHRLRREGVVE